MQTTEQIIAQARERIATRRAAALEQRWGGLWPWLSSGLVLAVLLVFLSIPLPLSRKLLLAMGGICGLRPAHSYFAGSLQLPIEARMVGIYGGFMVTLIVLVAIGRLGARQLGRMPTIMLLGGFFASMVIDGINSTMIELGWPHVYTSTNVTRLFTGLLAGIAMAPFLLWLVALVSRPPEAGMRRPVLRRPWELGLPLVANMGFAAMVMHEQALWYSPIALISVGGVVVALALTALLVVIEVGDLHGRITSPRQLVVPGAFSLLIAFAVLGLSAALRWSVTGSLY